MTRSPIDPENPSSDFLADYDYALPEALIALRPVSPRSSARLAVSTSAGVEDRTVADLPHALAPGDLLVVNNTRVLNARLNGTRRRSSEGGVTETQIEATLIERLADDRWRVLARPGKRLRAGDVVSFGALNAEVLGKGADGAIELRFSESGPALDAAVAAEGRPPLPPYIAAKRATDARDRTDYQTVFSHHEGAVAAPTAGLHFDPELLDALSSRGVGRAEVTLHVGAGTFLPATEQSLKTGRLHAEHAEVDAATVARVLETRKAGGRIIVVGTTTLRALETAALRAAEDGARAGSGAALTPWSGETTLFIRPGFQFRIADALLTNFHLPRSTLLMLVDAFVGPRRRRALYDHAVAAQYRFFSYGDASLLWPDGAEPGASQQPRSGSR